MKCPICNVDMHIKQKCKVGKSIIWIYKCPKCGIIVIDYDEGIDKEMDKWNPDFVRQPEKWMGDRT